MAIRDLTVCAAQHRQRDKERLSSEISIYSQKLIYERLDAASTSGKVRMISHKLNNLINVKHESE